MILPIAICRFADWTGHEIPFAVTIFRYVPVCITDAVFCI